jgi:hypothetical protein
VLLKENPMSNDLQTTRSNSAMNAPSLDVPTAQTSDTRRPYRAPTLRLLGSVQDLTLGTTTGPAEMGLRGQ